MKLLRNIARIFSFLLLLLVFFTIVSNLWVIYLTKGHLYKNTETIPFNKVGLVLGTSKKLTTGKANPFFYYRIEAAVKLYNANKVNHIIVSGDNETRYYNEPLDMQKALVAAGIPKDAITLDYAGFRTLDSVVRCKKVFGQENVTIITQRFHSFRALFIADFYDLKAQAFVAENLPLSESFKVLVREVFARPKAIIDIYFLKEHPKFLGEEVPIEFKP